MATRPTRPSPPAATASSPEPAAHRLVALRLAAAAQLIEAVGLCVAGVFAAISTTAGRSHQLAGGIAVTLIAFGTAAGLAAIAVGLARARPWSRIPAAMTQLFVIIVGIALLDGRPEWGVPALLLAGVCVAGLLTPASLRALNRPPAGNPPAAIPSAGSPPAGSPPRG
jgi:hypothetical protein